MGIEVICILSIPWVAKLLMYCVDEAHSKLLLLRIDFHFYYSDLDCMTNEEVSVYEISLIF